MKIDVFSVMLMSLLLTLLLAGLLALAGLKAGGLRGIREWAVANLCIGMGMGSAILFHQLGYNYLALAFANLFVMAGLLLFYSGIRVFLDKTGIPLRWILAASVFIALGNYLFSDVSFVPRVRVFINSLAYTLIPAACARALWIPVARPLRISYWFTGAIFATFSALMGLRLAFSVLGEAHQFVWGYPASSGGALVPVTLTVVVTLFTCLFLLCMTFGFVLMVNHRLSHGLSLLAAHDSLTGALNRRATEAAAARLVAEYRRSGMVMSVLMLDLDHFKAINDRFGHAGGDEVLRRFADRVREVIRIEDHFGRYGGEEFCVLLPNTPAEGALRLAERLRVALAERPMELGGRVALTVTVSIGVTDSRLSPLEYEALVKDADHALYQAKKAGRNRVMLAHTPDSAPEPPTTSA